MKEKERFSLNHYLDVYPIELDFKDILSLIEKKDKRIEVARVYEDLNDEDLVYEIRSLSDKILDYYSVDSSAENKVEEKFVAFDYQRWLDGDDVFIESGKKVSQLFRFEDMPDKPLLGGAFCMVGCVNRLIIFSDVEGVYQGKQYLFMKKKNNRIFVVVKRKPSILQEGSYMTSCGYKTKQGAIDSFCNADEIEKEYKIFELEMEDI